MLDLKKYLIRFIEESEVAKVLGLTTDNLQATISIIAERVELECMLFIHDAMMADYPNLKTTFYDSGEYVWFSVHNIDTKDKHYGLLNLIGSTRAYDSPICGLGNFKINIKRLRTLSARRVDILFKHSLGDT